jgi:hypothetical protein
LSGLKSRCQYPGAARLELASRKYRQPSFPLAPVGIAWRRWRLEAPECGRLEAEAVANIPLTEEEREEILARVGVLEVEHKDLDDVITRLTLDPGQDALQLRRLKKRKLLLKDQIARLRDRLIPDIIA